MADLRDAVNISPVRLSIALLVLTVCLLAMCAAQPTPRPVVLIDLRLVNGSTHAPNSGRVEVLYSTTGVWLNVCDFSFWGENDGSVACRQLGYPGYSRVRRGSYFGEGSNNGSVGAISCDGNEANLGQCQHGPVRESTKCEGRVSGLICTVPGFVGCYADSRDDRVFTDPRLRADNMTVGICRARCRELAQRYAGLENKRDCYCGDAGTNITKHGRLLDKECRSDCSGNEDEVCGGGNKLSIYDLTLGHCPDPGAPVNGGRVSSSMGVFNYASKVAFYCDEGFELVGSDTITCVLGNSPQNVQWSAPPPRCADLGNKQASSTNLGQVVGIVIACVVFLLLLVIFATCIMKRKRNQRDQNAAGAPLENIYAQADAPTRYQTSQEPDTQYQGLTLPPKETEKPYTSLKKRDPQQSVGQDIPAYFEFDDDYSPVGASDGAATADIAVGQTKQLPSAEVDDNEYSFVDPSQQTKDFNVGRSNHSPDDNTSHHREVDSVYYNLPHIE